MTPRNFDSAAMAADAPGDNSMDAAPALARFVYIAGLVIGVAEGEVKRALDLRARPPFEQLNDVREVFDGDSIAPHERRRVEAGVAADAADLLIVWRQSDGAVHVGVRLPQRRRHLIRRDEAESELQPQQRAAIDEAARSPARRREFGRTVPRPR